ncbi:hypothetical protein BHE74_00038028 [Ensete ventricosum]|nr:hypothetical protein BHE74_00038028 [Ensete ventricosum]
MFHLPSWGEEIARGRRIMRAVPDSRSYSSPLLLSPSLGCYHPKLIADSRNRPLLPHSGRRRLKSTVIGRFRVVMGWKQPQSAVLPGIGRLYIVLGFGLLLFCFWKDLLRFGTHGIRLRREELAAPVEFLPFLFSLLLSFRLE